MMTSFDCSLQIFSELFSQQDMLLLLCALLLRAHSSSEIPLDRAEVSSALYPAARAIDGNAGTHTATRNAANPWLRVWFKNESTVGKVSDWV